MRNEKRHSIGNYLYAVGHTTKGEIINIKIVDKVLECDMYDLVKIEIPHGVEDLWCNDNKLIELYIPYTVKYMYCYNNNFSNIVIEDTDKNPSRLIHLECDKRVLNLENMIDKISIALH